MLIPHRGMAQDYFGGLKMLITAAPIFFLACR
jgi:hypothetical protein